jgi:hypothetical protein
VEAKSILSTVVNVDLITVGLITFDLIVWFY